MSRKALAVKILVWLVVVIAVFGVGFCLIYQARHPVIDYVESRGPTENKADQGGVETPAVQQSSTKPNYQPTQNEQSYAGRWSDPTVILTALLVIGVGITNYIYYGQLKRMRETVALLVQQGVTMKEQSDAAKRQAEMATGQLVAMQSQERAMHATVTENKRMAEAAMKSIEIAEVSEAPYFGIIGIQAVDFAPGYYTGVDITFFNGGKTPAWHVFPLAHFIVGEHPDFPEAKHSLELITTDIESTFFGTEHAHAFQFRQSKFALTEDIVNEKKGLFLIVTVDYLGRGGVSKGIIRQNFICLWEKGKFCDWLPADNSPQYSKAD